MMSKKLSEDLLAVAGAYADARELAMTTVGQHVFGDRNFFMGITKGTRSFTVRKYDEGLIWFSENWPAGVSWPKSVRRPKN